MCSSEISYLCVLVGKIEEQKIYLSLNLIIIKSTWL